jgi:heavy metal translocating P-type ATPase
LPITVAGDERARGAAASPAEPLYCCYGCRLVSRIVGRQGDESVHAWNILRLAAGTFLAMNVMTISLLLYTSGVESAAVAIFRWVLLGLSAPAVAILVYPFALGAVKEIASRRLSLDTLIALGSLTAFAVSAANTIRNAGEVYFDTATMLPVLVTFGRIIEATAKARTGRLMRDLETLLPEAATRLESGAPRQVPLGELRVGDRVRVAPGERFPVDGGVVEGTSTIEEAAFTGESEPRLCRPGDAVSAGTVNGEGSLVVEARQVGPDVLLHRIVEMVREARERLSPSQRLADRAAALLIPAVLVLAAGAGLYWLFAGEVAQALKVVLAVIVVACPCAMGLAAPLATALAIGRAAGQGVLVRGGDVLERAGQVDLMFFDKTGTLTVGRPALLAVETFDGVADENDLLAWLAGLESGSEHALGRAVVAAAVERRLELGTVANLRAVPGRGVVGRVTRGGATREVAAGTEEFVSPKLLRSDHKSIDGCHGCAVQQPCSLNTTANDAAVAPDTPKFASVVTVAWDGELRGRVLLHDAVRAEAAEALRCLKASGVQPVLLSGDRLEVAQHVAAQVGIDWVEAPFDPAEKIALVRRAAAAGHIVGMVGDGINDAPALAAADVGVALGAGTDLARHSAAVVLLSNHLGQIPWLMALSRKTRRIIKQNLAWAVGYNAIALAAAAAGWLHPLLAALAMVVSSLTVLANSSRLLRFPAAAADASTGHLGLRSKVAESWPDGTRNPRFLAEKDL